MKIHDLNDLQLDQKLTDLKDFVKEEKEQTPKIDKRIDTIEMDQSNILVQPTLDPP